ncbi:MULTISPECIES: nSTAND1 domain-containing NTPase [Acinetobacter calcoaceticus/baumannii complex]|uniref:nSTAND1 domain-containing NTPase n=1 Tax=Acinetobacter calcoaceticus/baumannii complex TaxID=909768 RepID=UPI001230DD1F|nr:restriction endonuclease [Acinetobacter pittii]
MSTILPLEKNIIVSVPHEYTTPQKGAYFEKLCAQILRKQSYEITGYEVRRTGMEIDLEAIHKPSQKTVYIECKFFNDKSSIDSKIVDLCFAQSFRGEFDKIALFSTVKLGKDAQGTYDNYLKRGIDFSYYDSEEILSALEVSGQVPNIDTIRFNSNVTSATLLIHPELVPVWLLQESENGSPTGLIAYVSPDNEVSLERIRQILDNEGKLEELDIKLFEQKITLPQTELSTPSTTREVVSGIVLADDIMDPKPCRPKDFIGRDDIQKEIWDFLESVRTQETDSRILALTGLSGNGKSSLVANLSDRFTNKKWKNKLYLYPVDVRSARGSRFVAEAVGKAFNTAVSHGFIESDTSFTIENIDEITGGKAFQEYAQFLEKNNKVMVIFFDQFEEVFMKEELFSLFRAFRRFALDISAEKTNVVVGFSWRTGIFLGNDNPAYGLWYDLRDHRTERKLKTFDVKDSNKMISSFEIEAEINLTKPLKARLIQQAQGFPWFLKKLCIHLFKKIKEGISQEELLISQMQIKNLFDEDLERPSGEVECLKFVAKKSPVDRYEATREFGENTVSRLIADRLLIKTGEKISVYWDVFRDYLITNETPVISWAFMPNYRANMSLKFVELIKDQAASIDELVEKTTYSRGTIQNILIDLLSFALVVKTKDDKYKLNCEIDEIPLKVRNQMLGHFIYQEALAACKNNEESIILIEDMSLIINKAYASDEGKTVGRYVAKILSWLRFAGLMSQLQDKVRVYDAESYSPDFGEITGGSRKTSLFLAASSFEKAAILLDKIILHKPIDLAESGIRNVIADLVALGICRRVSNNRIELTKPSNPEVSVEKQLANKVLEANTIILLEKLISLYGEELNVLVEKMSVELGKNWKQTSGQRYINALLRYRNLARSNLLH